MKILSWNCNGALRRKFSYLDYLSADVVVIQECENPEHSNDEDYKKWAGNYLWIGDNPNKGLGIFAKQKVQLSLLNWEAENLQYFIACSVNNCFNLVGVWCHGANEKTFQYIGQFWKYFQQHGSKFGECVLAGDFNSNPIWDKPRRHWNHTDVVSALRELNIESFYHLCYKETPGEESRPTFFLHRNVNKPYHLDYIFGSASLRSRLKGVSVGAATDWLEISDHMPLICELKRVRKIQEF